MFMAYLNMFNSEQQGLYTSFMDPRISFSNDFADTQQADSDNKYESSYREAPVSSDFEFSVKNYTMIPADEIFFKGMMMPLKDNSSNQLRKTTLREELLADDEFDDALPSVPKSSGWWKERLGLKRGHIAAKTSDKNNGVMERVIEEKRTNAFVHDEGLTNKGTQEVLIEARSSSRDSGI